MGVAIRRSNTFSAHGEELCWWGDVLYQGPVKGSRDGIRWVGFDPGKRQGSAWIISWSLQWHMGWTHMESASMGKAHCKKLKRERWLQLGYPMHRENGVTPQHHGRYSQIRPGALGILQYANRVSEIIPVRQVRQRKNWWTYPIDGYQERPILIIQANSTLLIQ